MPSPKQADRSRCAPVVVEMVALKEKASTAIHSADALRDQHAKTGAAIAELGAQAAIKAFREFIASHSTQGA